MLGASSYYSPFQRRVQIPNEAGLQRQCHLRNGLPATGSLQRRGSFYFQGEFSFLATTATQKAKTIDHSTKEPRILGILLSEREKDLNGPSIATFGLFGQPQATEQKKPFTGEENDHKFRTPFSSRGTTGHGSLERRVDKGMQAWSSDAYSLAILSPTEIPSETTTAITCSAYYTPTSL